MDFIKSMLAFEGRRSRLSYFLTMIGLIIATFVMFSVFIVISILSPTLGVLIAIPVFLILTLACFTVGAQRIRDFNQSGAWVLVFLIPYVGVVAAIAMCFVPPTPGNNRYGEEPNS
jgi:uncharacterized membrane protein YhaH (DUF805 family)